MKSVLKAVWMATAFVVGTFGCGSSDDAGGGGDQGLTTGPVAFKQLAAFVPQSGTLAPSSAAPSKATTDAYQFPGKKGWLAVVSVDSLGAPMGSGIDVSFNPKVTLIDDGKVVLSKSGFGRIAGTVRLKHDGVYGLSVDSADGRAGLYAVSVRPVIPCTHDPKACDIPGASLTCQGDPDDPAAEKICADLAP